MNLIASVALGFVESIVGTGDQAFNVVASLGQGVAERGGDAVENLIGTAYLDPQRLDFESQSVSKRVGLGVAGAFTQDYAELLSAIARRHGVGGQQVAHELADML